MEFNQQGEAIRINGISFDITDRKQAEDAVAAVALFPAQNPSPVLRVNRAGILLYKNPASERLLKELHLEVGQPVQAFLRELVDHSLRTTRPDISEHASGSRHYLVSVTPIGHENYANLYWTDVTELRASERLMRAIFNQQFAFSALLSPEGQLLQLSESVYRNNEGTNIQPQEWIGRSFLEAPWWRDLPDTVAEWSRQFAEALRQPGPARGEAPYRLGDGELRYAMNTVTALRSHDGTVEYLLCEGMDITARRRAEIALRESEERLKLAMQSGGLGAWETDLTTGINRWGENIAEMLGVRSDQPATADGNWMDFIHPEDRCRVSEEFDGACKGNQTFRSEFRVLHRNGKVRWFASQGRIVISGESKRMVGIVQDITERKHGL
jgi:PAS domain S-box-containing protein